MTLLNTIVTSILSVMSFILTVISVITVIITLKQNKKILELTEEQIKEMRKEHQLSVQPILELKNEIFYIERPRLFYSPPEDELSFLSRCFYEANIKNISSVTAICIDISRELIIEKDGKSLSLNTVTERCNVLPYNEESDIIKICFTGDHKTYLYEALRERQANKLPKLQLTISFKNTCGGCFVCKKTNVLIPNDDDFDVLKSWHKEIIGGPIEEKETIEILKNSPKNQEWRKAFEACREIFDLELEYPEKQKINVQLNEIPEKYDFYTVNKEEYEKIASKYSYSRLIHKTPNCLSKKRSSNDV